MCVRGPCGTALGDAATGQDMEVGTRWAPPTTGCISGEPTRLQCPERGCCVNPQPSIRTGHPACMYVVPCVRSTLRHSTRGYSRRVGQDTHKHVCTWTMWHSTRGCSHRAGHGGWNPVGTATHKMHFRRTPPHTHKHTQAIWFVAQPRSGATKHDEGGGVSAAAHTRTRGVLCIVRPVRQCLLRSVSAADTGALTPPYWGCGGTGRP